MLNGGSGGGAAWRNPPGRSQAPARPLSQLLGAGDPGPPLGWPGIAGAVRA